MSNEDQKTADAILPSSTPSIFTLESYEILPWKVISGSF